MDLSLKTLEKKYDKYDRYESYLIRTFYKHYYNFIELHYTRLEKN